MNLAKSDGFRFPFLCDECFWKVFFFFRLNISKNNLYVWETYIKGPEGTPYEGGCFEFEFKFSAEYPFVAPKVRAESISLKFRCDLKSIVSLFPIID